MWSEQLPEHCVHAGQLALRLLESVAHLHSGHPLHDLEHGGALEQHLRCEQLVENRPEREEVGTPVEVAAQHLLGAHVGGRAANDALRREGGPRRRGAGDPEVHHLHDAVMRADQVRRLQVPVDDHERVAVVVAKAVRVVERPTTLNDDIERGAGGDRLATLRGAGQQLLHRLAFYVLQHEDIEIVVLLERERLDDVWVAEHPADGRFAHQQSYEGLVLGELQAHDLQCDLLPEASGPRLLGEIDGGHGP